MITRPVLRRPAAAPQRPIVRKPAAHEPQPVTGLAAVGGYFRIVTGHHTRPSVREEFQMPGDTYRACDDAWTYMMRRYSDLPGVRLERWYDPVWVEIKWRLK